MERHPAATALKVPLLLKTGTAHQIWSGAMELFRGIPFPSPGGITGKQHIP